MSKTLCNGLQCIKHCFLCTIFICRKTVWYLDVCRKTLFCYCHTACTSLINIHHVLVMFTSTSELTVSVTTLATNITTIWSWFFSWIFFEFNENNFALLIRTFLVRLEKHGTSSLFPIHQNFLLSFILWWQLSDSKVKG